MTPTDIQRLIEEGIPGSRARVRGEDGVHFEASVVSPAFRGLNALERHRLVYQSLGRSMESAIHALSIKTLTPEERDALMQGDDAQ